MNVFIYNGGLKWKISNFPKFSIKYILKFAILRWEIEAQNEEKMEAVLKKGFLVVKWGVIFDLFGSKKLFSGLFQSCLGVAQELFGHCFWP